MDLLPPAIILVEPQLGENIGAAARAMGNCALSDLRLTSPRDGWPNHRAWALASGATSILDHCSVFTDVPSAVADLGTIYATTSRHRDMVKHVVTPRQAASEMRERAARGERCGILFGRERIGLTNDELSLAEAIVQVPLNPEFTSLNLAQAVLLIGYEWFVASDDTPSRRLVRAGSEPATKDELVNFFDHLQLALDSVTFFKVKERRATQLRKIRSIFLRAGLTDQEVGMLHGVVTALIGMNKGQLLAQLDGRACETEDEAQRETESGRE